MKCTRLDHRILAALDSARSPATRDAIYDEVVTAYYYATVLGIFVSLMFYRRLNVFLPHREDVFARLRILAEEGHLTATRQMAPILTMTYAFTEMGWNELYVNRRGGIGPRGPLAKCLGA